MVCELDISNTNEYVCVCPLLTEALRACEVHQPLPSAVERSVSLLQMEAGPLAEPRWEDDVSKAPADLPQPSSKRQWRGHWFGV